MRHHIYEIMYLAAKPLCVKLSVAL